MQSITIRCGSSPMQIDPIAGTQKCATSEQRGSVLVKVTKVKGGITSSSIIEIYFDTEGNYYRSRDSKAVWFNKTESNNFIYYAYNSCRAQQ